MISSTYVPTLLELKEHPLTKSLRLVQPTFISYFNNPSEASIGGIVAAFSAGATFGAFGCALVADRYGRVWGLCVGAIIAIIGCALQAGAVHVNGRTTHDETAVAYGGAKSSSFGRFNPAAGL